MNKPKNTFNLMPTSTSPFMPLNIPDPSIRGDAWEQFIKGRGIRFIHKKATICPNFDSIETHIHVANCPVCDGNGKVYYDEKEVIGGFVQNSLEKNFEMQGVWDIGTAVAMFPTEYDDKTQCDLALFDKLTAPDFTVRYSEVFEYIPSSDNIQKLRNPITSVDFIFSVRNNQVRTFEKNIDYKIVDGAIQWIAIDKPLYDEINQRGEVISINYFAIPVFIVAQPLRELRVSQEYVDGKKVARRLPQSVVLRRDGLKRDF